MLVSLTACNSETVGETLGLNREAPDEFTVVSRPSLAVPPEFNLRPPKPGEAPRGATADAQARAALTGKEAKPQETVDSIMEPSTASGVTPVVEKGTPSGAGEKLLQRAGADSAKSDIREQLGGDAVRPADTSGAKSLLEKLRGKDKKEPVIDAKKEAERLRDNKDKGKPVTEGEVQVEKTKAPTVIDRLF